MFIEDAINILLRMFKKSLFTKVDALHDGLQRCYNWEEEDWASFFRKVALDYDSSTEQWNSQTREELHLKIQKEIDNFKA